MKWKRPVKYFLNMMNPGRAFWISMSSSKQNRFTALSVLTYLNDLIVGLSFTIWGSS